MAGLFSDCEVEVIDNSPEVRSAMEQAKLKALEMIGLQAEGYAKMLCPVDTGNLRNSISHDTDGDYAYIGTNVEYAAYVEYGTIRSKAQPYLRPAADDHIDEYKRMVEACLKNA